MAGGDVYNVWLENVHTEIMKVLCKHVLLYNNIQGICILVLQGNIGKLLTWLLKIHDMNTQDSMMLCFWSSLKITAEESGSNQDDPDPGQNSLTCSRFYSTYREQGWLDDLLLSTKLKNICTSMLNRGIAFIVAFNIYFGKKICKLYHVVNKSNNIT